MRESMPPQKKIDHIVVNNSQQTFLLIYFIAKTHNVRFQHLNVSYFRFTIYVNAVIQYYMKVPDKLDTVSLLVILIQLLIISLCRMLFSSVFLKFTNQ